MKEPQHTSDSILKSPANRSSQHNNKFNAPTFAPFHNEISKIGDSLPIIQSNNLYRAVNVSRRPGTPEATESLYTIGERSNGRLQKQVQYSNFQIHIFQFKHSRQ